MECQDPRSYQHNCLNLCPYSFELTSDSYRVELYLHRGFITSRIASQPGPQMMELI